MEYKLTIKKTVIDSNTLIIPMNLISEDTLIQIKGWLLDMTSSELCSGMYKAILHNIENCICSCHENKGYNIEILIGYINLKIIIDKITYETCIEQTQPRRV